MDSLKMHSKDITEDNINKIAMLFPNCITEAKDEHCKLRKAIDFDLLRQELSREIVEGPQERYQLNWPGKRQAFLTANAPIAKTLRPCIEESVDFDNTQNLFIEGDNLDALKMLQETYLGKVKMIYIDPPYNTGKDFVYKDNFAELSNQYLLKSGQSDLEGNRLFSNTETNGRFHSDWLSMMYSRIKLSRNLLQEDGILLVSIDENEMHNLQILLNDIFGETNFVATFIWQNKKGGGNDSRYCAIEHEYIILYAKNINLLPKLYETFDDEYLKRYKEADHKGRFYWDTFKRKSGKQYYPITCPDGSVIENDGFGNKISWLRSKERFYDDLKNGEVTFVKRGANWSILFKQRLPEGKKPRSLIINKGTTSDGSQDLFKLFEKNLFHNSKPISLIRYLMEIFLNKKELILDFFAGSSTSAHATMQLNAEDFGNRKFIMVQLPEFCDKKSEAFKSGYKSIAEISKERIRRAGKIIKEENADKDGIDKLDIGFRVLKVDSSSMADVYYTPNSFNQDLLTQNTDNIKPDRTQEDLLFQVLLDWGVDLTLPITKKIILDHEVFFVDENALVACFDNDGKITEEFVKELTQYSPIRVVFRDAGFTSDSVKINVTQIFKQLSPHTEVKTI